MKVARLHRRIGSIRKDFLHKLSTSLTKTKSRIVVENLHVSGMIKNPRLARSIADAGWGTFLGMLKYKCEWYECQLIEAPRFFASSKLCSNCGEKKIDLTLADRTYHCESCGYTADRDLNASINLVKLSTERSSGINASGDVSLETSSKEELKYTVLSKTV